MNRFVRKAEDTTSIVVSGIFLGLVVLAAAWGTSNAVEFFAVERTPPWVGVFVNYTAMLAVALILVIASSMGRPGMFGFVKPHVKGSYGTGVAGGLVLGMLASIASLASGGGRMAPLEGLSFGQIVLLVWILASVSEEVLVRGYVQSYLEPLSHIGFNVFNFRVSLPVLVSALFFAAMHLILLTTGTPFRVIYIVIVFAFFLGLIAARQREKTRSVLPPIVTHLSFNVGGVIGGVIFVLIQISLFGKTAVEVARTIGG